MQGHSYADENAGRQYADFAASKDGRFQQQTLLGALLPHLPKAPARILDAGCGTGWLTKELTERGYETKGCDISPVLLTEAKAANPGVFFETCDLNVQKPFGLERFDCAVANVVVHDLRDQPAGFRHLAACLKPAGKLLITIPNPYYTYPVGQWKRGVLGRLLGKKPSLALTSYREAIERGRKFSWYGGVPAYWYPLPEQLKNALSAGLSLTGAEDVLAETDSSRFDLNYRLYRFPLFLLLAFEERA